MTYEEFKEICLSEYPKIEQMVKTVKALGLHKVSCTVWADGHIHFDASESGEARFVSYHSSNATPGELVTVEYFKDGSHEWKPVCYYDHAIDNDETIDDLPFT